MLGSNIEGGRSRTQVGVRLKADFLRDGDEDFASGAAAL